MKHGTLRSWGGQGGIKEILVEMVTQKAICGMEHDVIKRLVEMKTTPLFLSIHWNWYIVLVEKEEFGERMMMCRQWSP